MAADIVSFPGAERRAWLAWETEIRDILHGANIADKAIDWVIADLERRQIPFAWPGERWRDVPEHSLQDVESVAASLNASFEKIAAQYMIAIVNLQLDLYDALFKPDGEPRSVTKLEEYLSAQSIYSSSNE